MQKIRIGVIGAGGVAQLEHVPNLLRLHRLFDLVAVYDPSAAARRFVETEFGVASCASLGDLLSRKLDAVLVASPDALHHEQVSLALGHGLHVFCEKPLCYAPADIDDLIAMRDRSGKVLQVGYMKRFDPAYEAAMARMPGKAEGLRYVSVEVNDPDAWPFIRHSAWHRPDDLDQTLVEEVSRKQQEQVRRAVPASLDPMSFRGFTNAYSSALVHDVNAVHGLLDALGVPPGNIAGAQLFAGGDGGQGTVRLLEGRAVWTMTHLTVPHLPDYRERISIYFDDASLELEFPSPWLNHHPTRLSVRTGDGHVLERADIHVGYEEAFVEELKGFWSAIVEGAPVRNTAEHARRDMKLLSGLAAWHATHTELPAYDGARP